MRVAHSPLHARHDGGMELHRGRDHVPAGINGKMSAALGRPAVLVQEGGYAVDEIGANVVGVLDGFARGS